MREKDINLLWMFTLRIAMYTGKENSDTIAAFLHGYESGTDLSCKFIHELTKSIETEYKIESRATGWIGQIDRLAEKQKTDWVTVFKKQSLKILTERFTESNKSNFTDSYKKRITSKLSAIESNYFKRDWVLDWVGIVDVNAAWFKEMWTAKELYLFEMIEDELKLFGFPIDIKTDLVATEKLKTRAKKLLKQIENN
jgi:hypothetical protein